MAQKSVKIVGKKVASLGDAGRLYVMVAGIGRTFIPKEHGIKEGELLNGTVVVDEVTYTDNADGTKRATPLVRMELVDYTSFASAKEAALEGMELAVIESKAANVANIKWEGKDYAFTKAVGAA